MQGEGAKVTGLTGFSKTVGLHASALQILAAQLALHSSAREFPPRRHPLIPFESCPRSTSAGKRDVACRANPTVKKRAINSVGKWLDAASGQGDVYWGLPGVTSTGVDRNYGTSPREANHIMYLRVCHKYGMHLARLVRPMDLERKVE